MAFFTRRLARTDDSGMTLVEVLAAMLIFAIVSTGLVYTMLQTLTLTRDARARQVALNLASQEIDRALSISDYDKLLAETGSTASKTVNGDVFAVAVDTQWVSDPDVELKCGASPASGVLRYKRVNVEVTWENMREGTDPVRSDTVVVPGESINDPSLGTILVSVLNGDGEGRGGVTISATPSSVPNGAAVLAVTPMKTDAQGCSYILKVVPGNYDVTATQTGYVNLEHKSPARKEFVGVAAGASTAVSFQYDASASYKLKFAGTYSGEGASKIRLPKNLPTTFVSSYGATQFPSAGTGTTSTRQVFPLSSGYSVIAGAYADTAGPTGCLSPNAAAWSVENAAGEPVPGRVGFGAARGGTSVDVDVPMGVVKITGVSSSETITITSKAKEGDDPGCTVDLTYDYGSGLDIGTGTVYLAVPYGTWSFSTGVGRVTPLTTGHKHGSAIEIAPEPAE
ncbi:hypothetical protein GCM10011331_16760 [Flavimobilis marinus]|uniref:Prepilin-type N-terminal cleavage/methylation domain-containing protein n=1 Tax=Flavimobilis marinus TaxID=285351 RepID=A0A1I2FGY2_9MICO|nr:prepilin-type N-terminal cleavage/methylation domain-containing protein [Flavimobilis marinus]GHG52253.1 hypothetical protein GCM10011331_16760 [Flavimobilis marinus]SFF03786.1 prepilin-type N-terminal cleavage/methylation domain-containing protein [Flavimobilis marinus]